MPIHWITPAGLFVSLVGSLFLVPGSQETPWEIRTIGGRGERERAFETRRTHFARKGVAGLALGFALQLVA